MRSTLVRKPSDRCNHLIGNVLYFSPKGSDDAWPDVAVRDLLDSLQGCLEIQGYLEDLSREV